MVRKLIWFTQGKRGAPNGNVVATFCPTFLFFHPQFVLRITSTNCTSEAAGSGAMDPNAEMPPPSVQVAEVDLDSTTEVSRGPDL